MCENLGCTILLATHNMEEAEKLCDRVAILNRGEIKVVDKPENIRVFSKTFDVLEVKLSHINGALLEDLGQIPCIEKKQVIQGNNPILILHFIEKEKYYSEIIDCLVKNATILDMRLKEPTFEDVFVSVLEGDNNGYHEKS